LRGVAAAAAFLVGCSGAASSSLSSPASAPATARSLALLDLPATRDGAPRGLDGDLDAPGVTRSRERFDADAAPEAPWFDGAWRDELAAGADAPPRARAEARSEREGAAATRFVALAPEDAGLHRLFAAPPEATMALRVRLRAPAGSKRGGLVVVPHGRAAPTAASLARALPAFDERGLGDHADAALDDAARGGWQELALVVAPQPGRASLSLSLVPSDRGLDVDFVELREVAFGSAVASRSRLSADEGSDPARRLLRVGGASVDASLLPMGGRATWRLALPAGPARLVWSVAAIAPRAGEAVAVELAVDGVALQRVERRAALLEAGQPLPLESADVTRFGGKEVSLSFAANGSADAVAALVAPRWIATAPEPRRARNLVVISLDTLRADALGCYGAEPAGGARGVARSPVIDALAAGGARFATVISPSSYTLPTHLSMLSGQHPYVHRLLDPDDRVDPRRTALLAQRLRADGYATAAFTGGGFVAPHYGFAAGFDRYEVDDPCGRTQLRRDRPRPPPSTRAPEVAPLEPALAWLRAHAPQPFFLFLHTFFVHNYTPSREWLARFDDPDAVVAGDEPLALRAALLAGDERAARRLRALYAATVAQVDAELVGRVVAELDALGVRDETLLCIVSDHGEEFGEHGGCGHGHELWSESTRVPWIVAGPGVAPRVVAEQVELADVAATLAALLELPREPRDFGRDALASLPAAEGATRPPLQVIGRPDAAERRDALLAGPWQLLRWFAPGQPERHGLFHLGDDPAARRDVAAEQPALVASLAARMEQLLAGFDGLVQRLPSRAEPAGGALTEEQRATLRELGYLDE